MRCICVHVILYYICRTSHNRWHTIIMWLQLDAASFGGHYLSCAYVTIGKLLNRHQDLSSQSTFISPIDKKVEDEIISM